MKIKFDNKIKFAVIISISSLIIALISFGFSIYKFNVDIEYKELQYDLNKKSTEFEQTYKKISLIEKSIFGQVEGCEYPVNKEKLNNNLRLLGEARSYLIDNNIGDALNKLKEVTIVCETYEPEIEEEEAFLQEIIIFSVIWVVLIISLIGVLVRRR